METDKKIKELFRTLTFPEKLSLLESLSTLLEEESQKKPDNSNVFEEQSESIIFHNSNQTTLLAASKQVCSECGSLNTIGWGSYKGSPRCKCNDCGRVTTMKTKTFLHGIKKKKEFIEYGELMFSNQYYSLSYLSKKFKIAKSTAFDWRHKYLSFLEVSKEKPDYSSEVEIDDIWFAFNEKGRLDKEDSRKRSGIETRGDNDFQVKVLFSAERGGEMDTTVVRSGRLKKSDIDRAIGTCFKESAVLISDKHPSIVAFAKDKNIVHKTFKAKTHGNKEVHVQAVNNLASRFKSIVNVNMRGVATKYLQNYANWFNFEERHKGIINKLIEITRITLNSNIAWDYYVNIEKIYKRFIENYSNFDYAHPTAREWKSTNWNYEKVEKLLI